MLYSIVMIYIFTWKCTAIYPSLSLNNIGREDVPVFSSRDGCLCVPLIASLSCGSIYYYLSLHTTITYSLSFKNEDFQKKRNRCENLLGLMFLILNF